MTRTVTKWQTVSACLVTIAAIGGACQTAGAQGGVDLKNVGIDQKLNAQAPLDIKFRDETNQVVSLRDYLHGKPALLVLPFYRCAGACTLELDGMRQAFNSMEFTPGTEFNVITLSIDPRESFRLAAEKKSAYLAMLSPSKRAGAEKGWHFLTGDDASIHALAAAVGFRYVIAPKNQQPIHPTGLIVLTPEGRVSRYLLGVDYPARDLRLSLVDASDDKIGTLSDKLTLLCTHFDPTTSRYGVAIDRIIKFTCTLTVLLLASFIIGMFRFEKRRNASQALDMAKQRRQTEL
jgi:protein SCO1/2